MASIQAKEKQNRVQAYIILRNKYTNDIMNIILLGKYGRKLPYMRNRYTLTELFEGKELFYLVK
jgi:hypothetical protein